MAAAASGPDHAMQTGAGTPSVRSEGAGGSPPVDHSTSGSSAVPPPPPPMADNETIPPPPPLPPHSSPQAASTAARLVRTTSGAGSTGSGDGAADAPFLLDVEPGTPERQPQAAPPPPPMRPKISSSTTTSTRPTTTVASDATARLAVPNLRVHTRTASAGAPAGQAARLRRWALQADKCAPRTPTRRLTTLGSSMRRSKSAIFSAPLPAGSGSHTPHGPGQQASGTDGGAGAGGAAGENQAPQVSPAPSHDTGAGEDGRVPYFKSRLPSMPFKMSRLFMFASQQNLFLVGQNRGPDSYSVIRFSRTAAPPPPTQAITGVPDEPDSPKSRRKSKSRTASNASSVHSRHSSTDSVPIAPPRPVPVHTLASIVSELPRDFTLAELNAYLASIHLAASSRGGLHLVTEAVALVGVVKFLSGYYVHVVTQARLLGMLGSHQVFAPTATELVPVSYIETRESNSWSWKWFKSRIFKDKHTVVEDRYVSLYQTVDLTRDFYFSYTLDLTRPIQHSMVHVPADEVPQRTTTPPHPRMRRGTVSTHPLGCENPMFVWNDFLTKELLQLVPSKWAVPILHGYFKQLACSQFGRGFSLTLIGRRCRVFAGTRYLKRGINDEGYVANDVEVEQVVDDLYGRFAAYRQVRGSVPVYWGQETKIRQPKPPILLNSDPMFIATRRHFEQLFRRYGAPILVLNLVKKRLQQREILIGTQFADAVAYMNRRLPPSQRVQYLPFDFTALSHSKRHNVVEALHDVSWWAAANTGFFASDPVPGWTPPRLLQRMIVPPSLLTPANRPPHRRRASTQDTETDGGDSVSRMGGTGMAGREATTPTTPGAADEPPSSTATTYAAWLARNFQRRPGLGYKWTMPKHGPQYHALMAAPLSARGPTAAGVRQARMRGVTGGSITSVMSARERLLLPPHRMSGNGSTRSHGSSPGPGASAPDSPQPAALPSPRRGVVRQMPRLHISTAALSLDPRSSLVSFPVAETPASRAGGPSPAGGASAAAAAAAQRAKARRVSLAGNFVVDPVDNVHRRGRGTTSDNPLGDVGSVRSRSDSRASSVFMMDPRHPGGGSLNPFGDDAAADVGPALGDPSRHDIKPSMLHRYDHVITATEARRAAAVSNWIIRVGHPPLAKPRAARDGSMSADDTASALSGSTGRGSGTQLSRRQSGRFARRDSVVSSLSSNGKGWWGGADDESDGDADSVGSSASATSSGDETNTTTALGPALCPDPAAHTLGLHARRHNAREYVARVNAVADRLRDSVGVGGPTKYLYVDLVGGGDPSTRTSVPGELLSNSSAWREPSSQGAGSDDAPGPLPGRDTASVLQRGVLRTNCVDCLDRTNVAQFFVGVRMLGMQLHALGLSSSPRTDPKSAAVLALMELYEEMGDRIAIQYGGSEAHKKVHTQSADKAKAKRRASADKSKEVLTSIKRYVSNSFTDRLKQDGMNLFLGVYQPLKHGSDGLLWQLDTDFYLHNLSLTKQGLHAPPESISSPTATGNRASTTSRADGTRDGTGRQPHAGGNGDSTVVTRPARTASTDARRRHFLRNNVPWLQDGQSSPTSGFGNGTNATAPSPRSGVPSYASLPRDITRVHPEDWWVGPLQAAQQANDAPKMPGGGLLAVPMAVVVDPFANPNPATPASPVRHGDDSSSDNSGDDALHVQSPGTKLKNRRREISAHRRSASAGAGAGAGAGATVAASAASLLQLGAQRPSTVSRRRSVKGGAPVTSFVTPMGDQGALLGQKPGWADAGVTQGGVVAAEAVVRDTLTCFDDILAEPCAGERQLAVPARLFSTHPMFQGQGGQRRNVVQPNLAQPQAYTATSDLPLRLPSELAAAALRRASMSSDENDATPHRGPGRSRRLSSGDRVAQLRQVGFDRALAPVPEDGRLTKSNRCLSDAEPYLISAEPSASPLAPRNSVPRPHSPDDDGSDGSDDGSDDTDGVAPMDALDDALEATAVDVVDDGSGSDAGSSSSGEDRGDVDVDGLLRGNSGATMTSLADMRHDHLSPPPGSPRFTDDESDGTGTVSPSQGVSHVPDHLRDRLIRGSPSAHDDAATSGARPSLVRALTAARSFIASRVMPTPTDDDDGSSLSHDDDSVTSSLSHGSVASQPAGTGSEGWDDPRMVAGLGHGAALWASYEKYLDPNSYRGSNLKTSFEEEAEFRIHLGDQDIPADEPELVRRWQRACGARYNVKYGNNMRQEVPRDTPVVPNLLASADTQREYTHYVHANLLHTM